MTIIDTTRAATFTGDQLHNAAAPEQQGATFAHIESREPNSAHRWEHLPVKGKVASSFGNIRYRCFYCRKEASGSDITHHRIGTKCEGRWVPWYEANEGGLTS